MKTIITLIISGRAGRAGANLRSATQRPLGARWRICALATAALLARFGALAYPPAPDAVLYGTVRDQYGTPLTDITALVVLETPTGAILSTTIAPGVGPGMNFQLKVPMDAGTSPDLYKPSALKSATLFKLYVVANGTTNVPIQMTGNFASLGKAGSRTRVDLTLGVDANGDNIPDAWEQAFLRSLGLNLNLNNLNANSVLLGDGRTLMQEFLLGNALFDPADSFAIQMVSANGGSPVLQFTTMTARSYTVLGSTDLQQWTPMSFTLPGDTSGRVYSYYYASRIHLMQIQVVQPTAGPAMSFFRLSLQ